MSSYISSIFHRILAGILINGGNIPKKIGIIMDGNRRYAQKHHIKKIEGHTDGMNTLLSLMKWAIGFGIEELTVFAFSVDNFNRSKEEVDDLLKLFKDNFAKATRHPDIQSQGVKISIYGNWSFFDSEIQGIFREIEEQTKDNKDIKLNVCIGYNSTEEITQAIERYKTAITDFNQLTPIDKFESYLYGGYNCKPDLIIRTSGETRLSNYLLYQSRFSMIIFIEKYWPEMSFVDFFKILLRYNYDYSSHIKKIKELEKSNLFNICEKEII